MTGTKRLITGSLGLALASTLFFNCLASADEGQVRKEIEAIYAKRTKATTEKNFDFVKSQQSDDYKEKDTNGTVRNRKEADAELDELASMVREVKDYSLKIDTIKEDKTKNEVIVDTSDSGKMIIVTPDNKPHEVFGRGRSRDVWRRTPQGWKLTYHEALESYAELDGKPVK